LNVGVGEEGHVPGDLKGVGTAKDINKIRLLFLGLCY